MNIEKMRSIIVIDKTGSLSKASKELYISQSALTNQLLAAEKELNFPIFDRSFSGVKATPAGEHFIKGIQEILDEYNDLVESSVKIARKAEKVLHVGVNHFNIELISAGVSCCMYKFPNINFEFTNCLMSDAINSVKQGTIDLAVATHGDDSNDECLYMHDIFNSRIYCTLSDSHPLASKKSIKLTDLIGYNVRFPTRTLSKDIDAIISAIDDEQLNITISNENQDAIIRAQMMANNLIFVSFHDNAIPGAHIKAIPFDWPTADCMSVICKKSRLSELSDIVKIMADGIAEIRR